MGLSASLNIGRTALTASQIAIQVTGNNLANASTPGYSRQTVRMGQQVEQNYGGYFLGRGVQVLDVTRQTDRGLLSRLNDAVSNESAANADQSFLSGVESAVNALGDNDLTSEFNKFFDAWSELANSPNRDGARALVVQQGRTLAGAIRSLRSDLSRFQDQAYAQLGPSVEKADLLFSQIAELNTQITNAEAGSSSANGLRDQRDVLIGDLSRLMDVSTIEHPSGAIDVLVGSTPVVLSGTSRGVELVRTSDSSSTSVSVNIKQDGTELNIGSGSIGSLLQNRAGLATQTIEGLDQIAGRLMFEVNRLHSQGAGAAALASATGTLTMPSTDAALALNDPANLTLAGLPFKAVNGTFDITVTNSATGASRTVRMSVDLDGLLNNGQPGYTDDTSVNSLAAQIGGVANLSASVQADGTTRIDAANGYTVSFGTDTSGVLAVLGINTYFTGKDASDIDVRAELRSNPTLLATGATINGQPSDNGTALAVAGLRTKGISALGGRSISQAWTDTAAEVGSRTAAAGSRASASGLVRQSLDTQRNAVSGVDLDEESINLLTYQRQYQGAARFITVVDDLMQTLLDMVK